MRKEEFELHDDKDKANTAIRSDQFGQDLRGDCPYLAQEFGRRRSCLNLEVWFLFQERIDAENSEIVERASGPCAERQIDDQDITELETQIRSEEKGRSIVLDLKDLTLVSRDAIGFLERCEADGVTLRNCAAYVREWITRQRGGS